jgi:hypothetical protein
MPHCQSTGRAPQPFRISGFSDVDVEAFPKFSESPVFAAQTSPPGTTIDPARPVFCPTGLRMSQSTTKFLLVSVQFRATLLTMRFAGLFWV